MRDEIDYIDEHFLSGKISILYPMRDFVKKEIMIYNHLFKVDILYKNLFVFATSSNLPFNGNSNLLLNSFFNKLQVLTLINLGQISINFGYCIEYFWQTKEEG